MSISEASYQKEVARGLKSESENLFLSQPHCMHEGYSRAHIGVAEQHGNAFEYEPSGCEGGSCHRPCDPLIQPFNSFSEGLFQTIFMLDLFMTYFITGNAL